MTVARLLPISTVLAALSLAAGYGPNRWAGALVITALGLLWLLGQRRHAEWLASLVLVFFVGAAVLGIWWESPKILMLIGVVAALAAWDLDHLVHRLRSVKHGEGVRTLERGHIRRLLSVAGLGLLLGAIALVSQVRLGLSLVFLLGLLAMLGLSGAIRFLRRESD
jgi:hypothetical protein